MATKDIERVRAIWASKAFRSRILTSTSERRNRSKQVERAWPAGLVHAADGSISLAEELSLWDQASDDDFSSFEDELG